MSEAALELELALHPDDVARGKRLLGKGRATSTRLAILWHDTPAGTLAADGLALAERRQGRGVEWRLERMWPADDAISPAGTPDVVLARADEPAGLGAGLFSSVLADELVPVAGFDGRMRSLPASGVVASLLEGRLRAAAGMRSVCRLTLAGDAGAVRGLALELAEQLRLAVPAASLAAEAQATAGRPVVPRRLGASRLPPGLSVGEAFAFVCAHFADVIQHFAPLAAAGQATEPVHQMRVAVRRLNSAIELFRKAVRCPELDEARGGLKELGAVLGPARDWDVFVTGIAQAVRREFPGQAGLSRLIAAASRRQAAAYAALRDYFTGASYRRLGIGLAALAAAAPWRHVVAGDADRQVVALDEDRQVEALATALPELAAQALDRRLRRLVEPGADIAGLAAEELHAIRLHAKRLRYAGELFAPLYSKRETSRFLKRISVLQERLGQLNDGAVAARLVAELAAAGGRGFAGGLVCGFLAARAMRARAKIDRSWHRLRRTEPFWE
jgi:triphosphatase